MTHPLRIPASSPGTPRSVASASRIRVLVVDDSIVVRRLVSQALETDRDIEVVGAAANGRAALERIGMLRPQAVTLDIEMPEMDGIETAKQIRARYPSICIIMCSSLTERGAAATLDALSAGANDYVTKPVSNGHLRASIEESTANLAAELVPKLKQFFSGKCPDPKSKTPSLGRAAIDAKGPGANPGKAIGPTASLAARRAAIQIPIRVNSAAKSPADVKPERRIVAIGVSTGGPNALAALMPMFPRDFPLPIVIVQHMPPLFTRLLAERLTSQSAIPIVEASDGEILEAGRAWLAPGNFHMRVREEKGKAVLRLDQEAPEHSCRPSVDVLFRSVAEVYGGGVIATVMTGMGIDGALGAAMLREQGAHIIAQDEATSVVWGMPGALVQSGIANSVVALEEICPEILKQL